MFLVGTGIPEHIKNLPQTFLNTPFGQMMKPHIDGALRGITQGPPSGVPPPNRPVTTQAGANNGSAPPPVSSGAPAKTTTPQGKVHNVSTLQEVESLLSAASNSCAVIFFTSSTCPPCKIVYPAYDELAAEAGDKATLIKVDINSAYDVSSKYEVTATPTFMSFLKGEKENVWSGADENKLRGNVRLLIQMAWPAHPHSRLRLPSLQRKISNYVTYKKSPPIDKLVDKLDAAMEDPVMQETVEFVKTRNESGAAEAPVPNFQDLNVCVKEAFRNLPEERHFALIDLFRLVFLDPRISEYFAHEGNHETLLKILSRTDDVSNCPYSLRLVMLQFVCNLFTSPAYPDKIISHDQLRETCIKLTTSCVQDPQTKIRVTAASLAYNFAVFNHNERIAGRLDKLSEGDQVELVAVLLDALQNEKESVESLHGLLLALGFLVYSAPVDGAVIDLCKAMGAAELVREKEAIEALTGEPLLKEVGRELLGKGLSN